MSDAMRGAHFPRPVLFAAGAVVGVTMLAAGLGRLTGATSVPVADAPPMVARDLRFQDQPDGGVAVIDAADGHVMQVLAPGTNAFLRATLRGMTRQRVREQQGPEVPFRLAAWPDGRLTLTDSVTGRHVELEAFGRTNEEVFARILSLSSAGESK